MNSAEQRFYVHPHPFLLMNNAEAIELWKKYADTGGADKNFMVSVCNWLLTFSTTIIGFAFALGVKIHLVPEKLAFSILAILGFVISIASAGIALIYGGYANWNWAKANQVAEHFGFNLLNPLTEPWTDEIKKRGSCWLASWLASLGREWARPADTYQSLAPIFNIYFGLSVASALVHITIVVLFWLGKLTVASVSSVEY